MRIDLLEDDSDQAALVSAWLESDGHNVRWFKSSNELMRGLHREVPDVLLLDWVLPESSGMDVLTWVRQSFLGKVPVVFLTAQEREEQIVQALSAGADDYLIKPARRRELLARIQALGRRAGIVAQPQAIGATEPYSFDIEARRVFLRGEERELTSKEFELAVYLFSNSGRLVTRGSLLERVWGRSTTSVSTRTVDAHVSRIRKKMDLDERNGWRLISIYQHGYRLERTQDERG
ncbi:MAG: response regulator transcription factor [Xanthomonadales bacterium]|jgi:DNA-binding response OmpR family regulator|nr:response regulator transcription factor [Xanthomonadales bacterium]